MLTIYRSRTFCHICNSWIIPGSHRLSVVLSMYQHEALARRSLIFSIQALSLTFAQTLSEIFAKADELGLSAMELVEQIHDSRVPDIKPAVKRKLSSFVNAIRKLRDQAKNVGARTPIVYISSLTYPTGRHAIFTDSFAPEACRLRRASP